LNFFFNLKRAKRTRGKQNNQENRKKKLKKPNREKKPIKPIKILKKPTGSVRFRFYKLETEKTEPNRKNRLKPV
jgi:hypothetical protein